VPIYLAFLGVEGYGLVGFYSTLLLVLTFADMGFTATVKREMASLSAHEATSRTIGDVLRTYEIAYAVIASALSLFVFALAPFIAEHWLQATGLNAADVSTAIRLMGFAIAFELLAGLYAGALMGLDRQVLSNGLQVGWAMLRAVGVAIILWLVSRTVIAFFAWQLFANVIYFVAARWCGWHAGSVFFRSTHPEFRLKILIDARRYAAGMAGVAIIFTLLTQLDKLAVSRLLSLEMLGYYTLAVALASVPTMLGSPVALAVFPRLTVLSTQRDRVGLALLYQRTCSLVSLASIPAGLTLAFLAPNFLFAWTGSHLIADTAGHAAALLMVGQVLQALQLVPFYVSLAHADVRINLVLGVVSVLVLAPFLVFSVGRFGIAGAGLCWVVLNVCILPIYLHYVHKRFGLGSIWVWLYQFLVLPVFTAAPVAALGYLLLPVEASRLVVILLIGVVWVSSLSVTILVAPGFRSLVRPQLRQAFRILTRQSPENAV